MYAELKLAQLILQTLNHILFYF